MDEDSLRCYPVRAQRVVGGGVRKKKREKRMRDFVESFVKESRRILCKSPKGVSQRPQRELSQSTVCHGAAILTPGLKSQERWGERERGEGQIITGNQGYTLKRSYQNVPALKMKLTGGRTFGVRREIPARIKTSSEKDLGIDGTKKPRENINPKGEKSGKTQGVGNFDSLPSLTN